MTKVAPVPARQIRAPAPPVTYVSNETLQARIAAGSRRCCALGYELRVSDLNIGTRLGLGFLVLIAMLCGSEMMSFSVLNHMGDSMDGIVNKSYAQIELSNQIKDVADQGGRTLSRLLMADNDERRDQYISEYLEIRKANLQNYKKLESMVEDGELKSIYEQQNQARTYYGRFVNQMMDLMKAGQKAQAMTVYERDMAGPQAAYFAAVDKIVAFNARHMRSDVLAAKANAHDAKLAIAACAVLAVVLGVVTAAGITRSVTRPIARAVALSEAVAAGDLTYRIPDAGKDEVGRLTAALQRMVESLHHLVERARHGADNINAAADDVSQGNQDLAARTEQQASALQETAAAMEQLTAAVRMNADGASQANGAAAAASGVAVEGGQVVGQVVNTMNSISTSSRRIVEIISVIDGIAFQTNIL
ncbi:MAG: HAMP domain-containing protein, partial [Roseateles sp.]